ncbi:hypothetical protein ACFW9W_44395, partial [Streptomyces sp. NPDC059468]
HGFDLRIGIGPTISVATTASARIPAPAGVLVVAPDQAAAWLAEVPSGPTLRGDDSRGERERLLAIGSFPQRGEAREPPGPWDWWARKSRCRVFGSP